MIERKIPPERPVAARPPVLRAGPARRLRAEQERERLARNAARALTAALAGARGAK